jgi:hypothetical protein
VKSQTTPRPASSSGDDFAICVRPADDGQQCWELLDDVGERGMCGVAADQAAALAMAQFAASAMQAQRKATRAY